MHLCDFFPRLKKKEHNPCEFFHWRRNQTFDTVFNAESGVAVVSRKIVWTRILSLFHSVWNERNCRESLTLKVTGRRTLQFKHFIQQVSEFKFQSLHFMCGHFCQILPIRHYPSFTFGIWKMIDLNFKPIELEKNFYCDVFPRFLSCSPKQFQNYKYQIQCCNVGAKNL